MKSLATTINIESDHLMLVYAYLMEIKHRVANEKFSVLQGEEWNGE